VRVKFRPFFKPKQEKFSSESETHRLWSQMRETAGPRRSSFCYQPSPSDAMRHLLFAVAVLLSPAARADDAADAKAIVERAIKARGDKLGAVPLASTWKEKIVLETVIEGNEKLVLETTWTFAPPDKLRIEMKLTVAGTALDVAYVLSGETVWLLVNGTSQENAKDQLGQALGEMNRMWATSLYPLLSDDGFKLALAKEEQVNGKPAAGVDVRNGKRPVVTLYFDKETGLLVKRAARVRDVQSGDAEVLEEVILSDFKEADGRKYHTKAVTTRDGKPHYTSYPNAPKVLKEVDAKLFAKPKG
jgi:hypothetical protein